MEKLRLGFIGAGGMADAHLNGLANPDLFPDVEIAAFCDVVLERAQAQAQKYGAQAFDAPRTMMAEAGLDGCYVLLPPFAHGDAERACIEAKVPFLVEKPAGLDAALLTELRDEIKTQNLLTAVGYMNRYQPSVQRAKAAFTGDEAVMALGGWLSGPPIEVPGQPVQPIMRWWVTKEKSGGQMHEQVTHTVDLVRYFLGEAAEVYAHSTRSFNHKNPSLLANYTTDDAMTTTLSFQNGAVATILASIATPYPWKVGSGIFLDIHGTKTSAHFSGWGHDVVLAEGEAEAETIASAPEIFPLEDRAFVDAVRSGDRSKIMTDYADACQTAFLTIAMNQSAASGKPVAL